MPVCIKSEPHKSRASVQPPLQAASESPSSKSVTANGSAPYVRSQAAATSVHQNSGPQVPRISNTSLPTSTMANPPSAVPNTNGMAEKEKVTPANVSEEAIDYDSVRGVFGWATLDDINVPYIIRKGKRFVAVRIVEKKVLNKYPNSFPDELGRKEPLVSYFVTDAEASLLNEINTVHCSFEYGHQPFTNKDLIVDLVEFEDFYSIVKKTFPENVLASITADEYNKRSSADERKSLLAKMCGWMQINNTVTPYIIRSLGKFVPLSVIQYAAQLLTKDQVEGHLPTLEECELLNDTCKAAGFEFTFAKNTKLIHIAEVVQRCRVRIFELPFDNPLQHAQYIDSLNQGEGAGGQPAPQVAPSGIVGSMSLPYQSKPSLSEGPPNMNPFNNPYDPFMSMMNMISQSPGTASNHSHPRTNHASSGPQLSVAHSQTAPVFYPPVPPAMSSRGSQMSQNPRMLQGQQNRMSIPPAMGNSGRASSSPQNQVGSPVSRSPQMQTHGNSNVGGGAFPHVSSPSLTRLPPPPSYPGSQQPRQSLSHPTISSPSAHGGTVPHPYMSSAQQTGRSDMVMPGSVSRGAGTMTGFPPGNSPSNRHLQSSQSQTQTGPPYQQIHPQSDIGVSTVPFQSPNSSVNPTGRPPHPGSNASAYPVQMSLATQNRGYPGRQPSMESVTKSPGSISNQTLVADDHLKLVGDIRAEMVNGKSISCMRRNSSERVGNFCLVEAVAKLYFPKCNLSEFVNALQNVLRINLPVCSEGEAKAFIHFYNLPVAKLNDNHMISLPDLKNYFPQISYMFRHAAADTTNAMALAQASGARRSSGSEGLAKMVSPSAPISIVLNNNDSSDVINVDSGPPTPVGHSPRTSTKRPVENNMVVGNKFSRPSLDQRVVRRGDEVDGNRAARQSANTAVQSSSSSVIVID